MKKTDIAMIGLGVMGSNLARNMRSKGFEVLVYDLDPDKINAMAEEGFTPCYILEELRDSLRLPRKVFLMVNAGQAVDDLIDELLPVLDPGDIIIDGGNSFFQDTIRRTEYVESKGLLYVGTGVSGGEEGALHGPSMMPGGSPAAWEHVKAVFQSICAKAPDGSPCCSWVGENGAGHFVKMVHNGIEYGDMQLICEAYHLLRDGLGLTNEELHSVFEDWNRTELCSYLIEITGNIFACRDEKGGYVIDKILDRAGQKGTGKWSAITALDESVPLTLISEAVYARCLSAGKEQRIEAAKVYFSPIPVFEGNRTAFIEAIRKALYVSRIISYTQGYELLRAASGIYGWNLDFGGIAQMWQSGCIIRSAFLEKIKEAFDRNPDLQNLLMDDYFIDAVRKRIPAWREVVSYAVKTGIPMPAFSSSLSWFDGFITENLPANLLQAQRDYFGAHTYERIDAPEGQFFHTDWLAGSGTSAV